jgi:hypothetical protein
MLPVRRASSPAIVLAPYGEPPTGTQHGGQETTLFSMIHQPAALWHADRSYFHPDFW